MFLKGTTEVLRVELSVVFCLPEVPYKLTWDKIDYQISELANKQVCHPEANPAFLQSHDVNGLNLGHQPSVTYYTTGLLIKKKCHIWFEIISNCMLHPTSDA